MTTVDWDEENRWWRDCIESMLRGEGNDVQWDVAELRLRDYLRRIPEARYLDLQEWGDAVQTVFLQLHEPDFLGQVAKTEMPANYLSRAMQNRLRTLLERKRKEKKVYLRHDEKLPDHDDLKPADFILEEVEWEKKTRFIVNHVLGAEDRKLIWWYYRDKVDVDEIAHRLGISVGAIHQRLSRARQRVREELEKKQG
jgi:RNA polymerase sigma factor (sigma-70 family)